jgi:colicin import membrane protein
MSTSNATAVMEIAEPAAPAENDQIMAVAVQSGLEIESAKSLQAAFAPWFAQAEEWRKKVETINITDASQVREMKLARETRLALREIRINAEHTRKKLKEDSVRKGKAIDGVANVLKFLIEPLEERLLVQEQFAERQEAARKAKLKMDREEQLKPFGVDTSFYALGDMPAEVFATLLAGSKAAHEEKLASARRAEEERLAKLKAEAEERERIRLENERLKKEAEEREAAQRLERARLERAKQEAEERARQEREAAAARLAEEKRRAEEAAAAERKRVLAEREAAEAKAKAEREKLAAENARRLAEEQKKAAAAAEVARKEREAREKAESEARAAREAEQKRLADEAEAKRRAAAAPDREKLAALAAAVRALEMPELATLAGVTLVAEIAAQREKFAFWIKKKGAAL